MWQDPRVRPLLALLLAAPTLALAACGSKTALEQPRVDAGPFDGPPPECRDDGDCHDDLDCTEERCEGRRCVRVPRDERCDDDRFCTIDRCRPGVGCVSQPNPCSDGVNCTEDRCDERLDRCEHAPQVARCPLSNRCDPVEGCVARALVHDSDALYEVDLPGGAIRTLAPAELTFTDLALHPDGTAYAINRRSLFELDQQTGLVRFLANLDDGNVALDVAPEGSLVTAGDTTVARVDRFSGVAEPFAALPPGLFTSGDIAFVGGRMLLTATDTPGTSVGTDDLLMEVPREGGVLVAVGDVGFPCVWGLAPFGDRLFGFTCQGRLLEIDPDSGAARELASLGGRRFGGAAAR